MHYEKRKMENTVKKKKGQRPRQYNEKVQQTSDKSLRRTGGKEVSRRND